MNDSQIKWSWQLSDWPKFHWQEEPIHPLLREMRLKQGILIGKTGLIAKNISSESALDTLLQNIIAPSAIEGAAERAAKIKSAENMKAHAHSTKLKKETQPSNLDFIYSFFKEHKQLVQATAVAAVAIVVQNLVYG